MRTWGSHGPHPRFSSTYAFCQRGLRLPHTTSSHCERPKEANVRNPVGDLSSLRWLEFFLLTWLECSRRLWLQRRLPPPMLRFYYLPGLTRIDRTRQRAFTSLQKIFRDSPVASRSRLRSHGWDLIPSAQKTERSIST
jgi:hypothetical protein